MPSRNHFLIGRTPKRPVRASMRPLDDVPNRVGPDQSEMLTSNVVWNLHYHVRCAPPPLSSPCAGPG